MTKGFHMNSQNQTPVMNQKIFDLGLSIETVSVYLLCCSLEDADTVISTKNLSGIWNNTKASLLEGLKDLEKRNILRRIISDRAGNNVYKLSDVKNWKLIFF
jgi:hypothetical protein